jgi:hypothetical protein
VLDLDGEEAQKFFADGQKKSRGKVRPLEDDDSSFAINLERCLNQSCLEELRRSWLFFARKLLAWSNLGNRLWHSKRKKNSNQDGKRRYPTFYGIELWIQSFGKI